MYVKNKKKMRDKAVKKAMEGRGKHGKHVRQAKRIIKKMDNPKKKSENPTKNPMPKPTY